MNKAHHGLGHVIGSTEVAPPVLLLVSVVEVVAAEAAPAMVLLAEVAPPMVPMVLLVAEDPPPPPPTIEPIEPATLVTLSLELSARRRLSEDFESACRHGSPTKEKIAKRKY